MFQVLINVRTDLFIGLWVHNGVLTEHGDLGLRVLHDQLASD
jgi:hypothetical protein